MRMLLLLGMLTAAMPASSVVLEDEPGEAMVGVARTVRLMDERSRAVPGVTLHATYREGVDGERRRALGMTDSRGTVRWVPEVAGPVRLHAQDVTRRVVVRPSAFPWSVALAWGALIVGGGAMVFYGIGGELLRRWRR